MDNLKDKTLDELIELKEENNKKLAEADERNDLAACLALEPEYKAITNEIRSRITSDEQFAELHEKGVI